MRKYIKKLSVLGTAGLLISAPVALAEDERPLFEDLEEEDISDIETTNNLDVRTSSNVSISVDGVEQNEMLREAIYELSQALESEETSAQVSIHGEMLREEVNTQVRVFGNLNERQTELLELLEEEVTMTLEGVEQATLDLTIDSDVIVGNRSEENREVGSGDSVREEVTRGASINSRERVILAQERGAEMRFVQLQTRLDANVENSHYLYDQLSDSVSDEVFDELDEIIANFITLQEEMENSSRELDNFLAFKDEINNLAREFRTTISPHFSEEEKNGLRVEVNQRIDAHNEMRRERIDELRRETNAELLAQTYEDSLGEVFQDLKNSYLSGELSLGEFRSDIRTEISQENRVEIQDRRREVREQAQNSIREMREQSEQRREEIRNRVERLAEESREKAQRQRQIIREAREELNKSRIQEIRDRDLQNLSREAREQIDRVRNR